MKKLFLIVFALLMLGLGKAQSVSDGYGFFYEPDFSVAGNDTVTSSFFNVSTHQNVSLGFSVSDSSKFEVVVYYAGQISNASTQYKTVTADTLTNTQDGGGFVTKVLRSESSDLIPAAGYIKVRVVRIATGSSTTVTLQGRVRFRN